MGTKKVAVYCRTANADESAIAKQKTSNIRYAEACGCSDKLDFYVDNGYSGNNAERPEFQRLSQDIADGLVETVIVYNLSRIGRNNAMRYKWIVGLQKHNVTLLSVTNPYEPRMLDMLRFG